MTDWSRIDGMTDEDIDTSDIPSLTEEFFAKARLRIPVSPLTVVVRTDRETSGQEEACPDEISESR